MIYRNQNLKNLLLVKNPQFWSDFDQIMPNWLSHLCDLIIKFHQWIKIVDFFTNSRKGPLRSPKTFISKYSDIRTHFRYPYSSGGNWPISKKFMFMNGIFWNFTLTQWHIRLTCMPSFIKIGGLVFELVNYGKQTDIHLLLLGCT